MGHAVVGLWHGWKLEQFIVGPIGIERNKEYKLTFYLVKNPLVWGGAMYVAPDKIDEDTIKIVSKILLGGPVASLVTASIFFAVLLFHFNVAILLLCLISLAICIVCSVPMKNGGDYNDGKRWLMLRKDDGQEAKETIAIFKIAEFERLKSDDKPMQKVDFEVLLNSNIPTRRYAGYAYLYKYYKAQNEIKNIEKAFNELQTLKKDVPNFVIEEYGIELSPPTE